MAILLGPLAIMGEVEAVTVDATVVVAMVAVAVHALYSVVVMTKTTMTATPMATEVPVNTFINMKRMTSTMLTTSHRVTTTTMRATMTCATKTRTMEAFLEMISNREYA